MYSTCTFAPEENECVIDTLLKQFPDEVRVLEVPISQVRWALGITAWKGRRLSDECKKTWRVWPHLNNTGGFFYCGIGKACGGGFDRNTVTTSACPCGAHGP